MARPGVGSRAVADAPAGRRALVVRGVGSALVAVCAAFAHGCGDGARTVTLVVASTLPSELLEAAERAFESANPSVDVRFRTGSAEETLESLRTDPAAVDVWWGERDRVLVVAAAEGLLQPYTPRWASAAVEADTAAHWHVMMHSPFVLAFNREEIELVRAPRDWVDLYHLRWTDEVVLADPTRSEDAADFVGAVVVEELRERGDLLAGFDRLARLDGQVGEYALDHADATRRLGSRQARVALLPRYVAEAARHGVAPWLHYRIPESGTPAVVRGVAVTAGTRSQVQARGFVDWLGTSEAATATKLLSRWEPAVGDVDRSRLPDDFELPVQWSAYAPAPDTVAAELSAWVDRWSREVRGRGAR